MHNKPWNTLWKWVASIATLIGITWCAKSSLLWSSMCCRSFFAVTLDNGFQGEARGWNPCGDAWHAFTAFLLPDMWPGLTSILVPHSVWVSPQKLNDTAKNKGWMKIFWRYTICISVYFFEVWYQVDWHHMAAKQECHILKGLWTTKLLFLIQCWLYNGTMSQAVSNMTSWPLCFVSKRSTVSVHFILFYLFAESWYWSDILQALGILEKCIMTSFLLVTIPYLTQP